MKQNIMAGNIGQVIEVDPKVYIMCRLCLEDKGRFQIVPTVQYQIKYCFDINVDHFDGLPPLLCQKCKNLLDEYTAHKKKFIEKQETLITKFKNNGETSLLPQSISTDTIPENAVIDDVIPPDTISLKTDKKKRNRLVSNSSADSQVSTKIKKKRKNQPKKGWKKNYIAYFVCNLCTNRYGKRKQVLLHLYNVHSNMKTKYHIILNKIWKVKLNKIDSKLNETKSTNTVMFNQDKVIQNSRNALYHVLYISKKTSVKRIFTDSSDDDFDICKKKRVNKPISRSSSNETILIEGNNNKNVDSDSASVKCEANIQESNNTSTGNTIKENNETECINIDDSSDSDIELNTTKCSQNTNNAKIEYKTIENIISVCKTKYLRKIESNKATIQSESLLKHKILSIGRKIIKKEGQFNCTGFLRYMEHKDLDISWLPKRLTKSNAESLVRIMTKLKSNNNIEISSDSSGWIFMPDRVSNQDSTLINNVTEVSNERDCDVAETVVSSNTSELPKLVEVQSSSFPSPFKTVQEIKSAVILSGDNSEINTHFPDLEINSKKLLNETPVANPKQLPKKISTHEIKLINSDAKIGIDNFKSPVFVQVVEEQNQPCNLFMPVITSTTSLANLAEKKNHETNNIMADSSAKDINKSVPRIKVKPASELMKPENILKTNDNHNIWPINSVESISMPNESMGNYIIPNIALLPQIQSVQSIQPSQFATIISVEQKSPEMTNNYCTGPIILDTVEIPNATTYSPFKYFKTLLSIHNISLLEPNAPILHDYICLLKIKVHFKQENKEKVVVLCLSLYCLREVFCICIKDTNQIDIQMTKISANWQWEILKIFQGDISNKVLQNAEKSGQDVYAKTKIFLCLLKSIKCRSL